MQISCPQHCGRKYDIMAWEHASNTENWNRHRNTENKQYSLFAGFPDFKAILIIFQGCNLGSRILGAWGWWHLCGRFEIKELGWTEQISTETVKVIGKRGSGLYFSRTPRLTSLWAVLAGWLDVGDKGTRHFLPPSTGSACSGPYHVISDLHPAPSPPPPLPKAQQLEGRKVTQKCQPSGYSSCHPPLGGLLCLSYSS